MWYAHLDGWRFLNLCDIQDKNTIYGVLTMLIYKKLKALKKKNV